jgi:hypothetical protein
VVRPGENGDEESERSAEKVIRNLMRVGAFCRERDTDPDSDLIGR